MQDDVRNVVFCHFGLLRAAPRMEQIVQMLPDSRRSEIHKLIEESIGSSAEMSKQRLRECRVAAISKALEQASAELNGRIDRAPIALQRWIVGLQEQTDGREDH